MEGRGSNINVEGCRFECIESLKHFNYRYFINMGIIINVRGCEFEYAKMYSDWEELWIILNIK